MMKTKYGMLAMALAISGCATAGKSIEAVTLVDAITNLASYKSYSWSKNVEIIKDPHGKIVPVAFDVDKEIRRLIDARLRDKGMTYTNDTPDAYVHYVVRVNMEEQEEMMRRVFGDNADFNNLTAGSLLIALIDAETNITIWAGGAVAQTLPERTDEKVRARLAAAVEKIFAQYPN